MTHMVTSLTGHMAASISWRSSLWAAVSWWPALPFLWFRVRLTTGQKPKGRCLL